MNQSCGHAWEGLGLIYQKEQVCIAEISFSRLLKHDFSHGLMLRNVMKMLGGWIMREVHPSDISLLIVT